MKATNDNLLLSKLTQPSELDKGNRLWAASGGQGKGGEKHLFSLP